MKTNETKEIFAQSLKKLMETECFGRISVSDIASHAGLSRKSFYNHFQDKYELVNWICYSQFVSIKQETLGYGGWRAVRSFLEFFASDRRFFVNALQDMKQNSFGQYFSDLLFEVIYETVAEGFRSKISDERWLNLSIAALVEDARLAILIWLDGSENPDVDELLTFLRGASDAYASMICFERALCEDGKLCDHAIDLLTDRWNPEPGKEALDFPMPNEVSARRREPEALLRKYRAY